MALTADQMARIERLLPLQHIAEGADQPISITLSGRELRFVLQAIAHYRDACCVSEERARECDFMYWYESAQGHLEHSCERLCNELIDQIITQVPERS